MIALLVPILLPAAGRGQQAAEPASGEEADLAKKLSNPISDLVSVPFQFNWEQRVSPDDQILEDPQRYRAYPSTKEMKVRDSLLVRNQ